MLTGYSWFLSCLCLSGSLCCFILCICSYWSQRLPSIFMSLCWLNMCNCKIIASFVCFSMGWSVCLVCSLSIFSLLHPLLLLSTSPLSLSYSLSLTHYSTTPRAGHFLTRTLMECVMEFWWPGNCQEKEELDEGEGEGGRRRGREGVGVEGGWGREGWCLVRRMKRGNTKEPQGHSNINISLGSCPF